MKKTKTLLTLLVEFMRFGVLTFGGGLSIVAQMQQLYVEKKQVMTAEDLLDMTSVAKSLPGTMIGNVAMFYGYRAAGLAGGLVCVFGMTVPPMLILIIISFFYNAFRTNYWVAAVMGGMQAAVVPIIASAALGMAKGSVKVPPCVAVAAVSLALYLLTDINAVFLILLGIAAGLILGEYYERREGKHHGSA